MRLVGSSVPPTDTIRPINDFDAGKSLPNEKNSSKDDGHLIYCYD